MMAAWKPITCNIGMKVAVEFAKHMPLALSDRDEEHGMAEVLNNATSRQPSGSWLATGLKAFPHMQPTVMVPKSPLAALWAHSG